MSFGVKHNYVSVHWYLFLRIHWHREWFVDDIDSIFIRLTQTRSFNKSSSICEKKSLYLQILILEHIVYLFAIQFTGFKSKKVKWMAELLIEE